MNYVFREGQVVEEYTAICILAGLAEQVSSNLSPLMDTVNFETIETWVIKRK